MRETMSKPVEQWARYKMGEARRSLKKRGPGSSEGEGSRGGVVVGHTKGGFPIYEPRDGHPDAGTADVGKKSMDFAKGNSSGYSKADHEHAAKALEGRAKEAKAAGNEKHAAHLKEVADSHKQIAAGGAAHHEKLAHSYAHGWRSVLASNAEKASAYRDAEKAHKREGNDAKASEMGAKAAEHKKKDSDTSKERAKVAGGMRNISKFRGMRR
jgi:hypothetical protein